MSVWVLEGFNTDSRYRDDVRHREYTTSKRTADLFNQIPKIQFTDSGHGIVFHARPHTGRKLPTRRMEYVGEQMARLRREAAPPARAKKFTPPLLTEGPLSGAVFVVTHGKVLPHPTRPGETMIESSLKYDVTDQFDALAAKRAAFATPSSGA